jgi:hypothetical protein
MSLSVVPSVNASSNIYDEPVHVDYNTYKDRMVEYIETPDYLKPSTAPIIGKNEYVDLTDIILASEDLLTVIPNISNKSISDVEKYPLFKTMNNLMVKQVQDVIEYCEVSVEDVPGYLDPFNQMGYVNQVNTFVNYMKIATDIKNIFIDNKFLSDNGGGNPFFTDDTVIMIDGVQYTMSELQDRISTAIINSDGTYHFTKIELLDSQIASEPLVPGDAPAASIEPPESVSVNSVARFINNNCYIIPPDPLAQNIINGALDGVGKSTIPVLEGNPFKGSDNGNPLLLASIDNENTNFIKNERQTTAFLIDGELRTDNSGRVVDIKPEFVNDASATLSIITNLDGNIVAPRMNNKDVLATNTSCVEVGIFFVFAIITLVLAFVYK